MTAAEKNAAQLDVYNPFTSAPLNDINHFPLYIFGVAIGYNLGSCSSSEPLKLSGRALSLIYSGVITHWNDPLLVLGDPSAAGSANSYLATCDNQINVAVHNDERSSTIVLKDYLSRQDPKFNVYKTKELNTFWPSTLIFGCRAAQGDAGMSTCLREPGTIGYVLYEQAYGDSHYRIAHVENSSRQFEAPATNVSISGDRTTWPDRCLAAASTAVVPSTTQDWSGVSLTSAPLGYPICSFSYTLVYQRLLDAYRGRNTPGQIRTVVDYLTVMAEDATQVTLTDYQVSYLPSNVLTLVRMGINGIRF